MSADRQSNPPNSLEGYLASLKKVDELIAQYEPGATGGIMRFVESLYQRKRTLEYMIRQKTALSDTGEEHVR